MVSQHFWPHLLGEDMRLHPSMQDKLAEFSKAYSVIKNPRLLVWKKQVGYNIARSSHDTRGCFFGRSRWVIISRDLHTIPRDCFFGRSRWVMISRDLHTICSLTRLDGLGLNG